MTQINFTESASHYIKSMVSKEPNTVFRLSIKKTGCSGYSYDPRLISEITTTDMQLVLNNGITVYLDTAWLHLLENITVDFIEEIKSGLKQKKLVFKNPKEESRCGCGESFHVSQDGGM